MVDARNKFNKYVHPNGSYVRVHKSLLRTIKIYYDLESSYMKGDYAYLLGDDILLFERMFYLTIDTEVEYNIIEVKNFRVHTFNLYVPINL